MGRGERGREGVWRERERSRDWGRGGERACQATHQLNDPPQSAPGHKQAM